MKKMFSILIVIILTFTAPYMVSAFSESEPAYPSEADVILNGKTIRFCSYILHGSNYFMLRDIAMALSDTEKQFHVSWNHGKIQLAIQTAYQPAGTEFTQSVSAEQNGVFSVPSVSLGNQEITLVGYNINGSNYFKIRDIARIFDFNVSYADGHIVIDTAKQFIPEEPYKPSAGVIGTAHEANFALFINEMPILSYYSTCDTAYNTDQADRLRANPRLNGVYVNAEDLDNYGFEKVYDKNNIYLTRSFDKQFGILDGEIINSKPCRADDVYISDKKVYLDGTAIKSIMIAGKPYIAASELLMYGAISDLNNPPGGLISNFDTRICIDFLKTDLYKKYVSADDEENIPINSGNAADFGFAGKSNFFGQESKFSYKKSVEIGKLLVTYPYDDISYIGGFNGYRYDGKGIYCLKHDWSSSGPGIAPGRYYVIERGIFQDGTLYDGINYTQGYGIVGGTNVIHSGMRIEGAMKNGYRREAITLPLNIMHSETDKNFRFGYRILCEGEVKDGKYSGYYRKYDENGTLIFEGNYADFLSESL